MSTTAEVNTKHHGNLSTPHKADHELIKAAPDPAAFKSFAADGRLHFSNSGLVPAQRCKPSHYLPLFDHSAPSRETL